MRKGRFFIEFIAIVLTGSVFISGCTSATLIQSTPSGAKLYLDGEPVGNTPYKHKDSKVVTTTTRVKLELDGYETLTTTFSKDEEINVCAACGGIFFLVPWLWVLGYKDTHTYELKPIVPGSEQPVQNTAKPAEEKTQPVKEQEQQTGAKKSKADQLRELKQLLDEKIITEQEFEKEKKKILESDDK